MCYAGNCNPECGQCRPKRLLVISCPNCGARCAVTREQYLNHFDLPHKKDIMEIKALERGLDLGMSCKACGADIEGAFRAAMPEKVCKRMGVVCGYPCGRADEEPTDTNAVCNTCVPMCSLGRS